jgi:hypothetical protein
LPAAAAITRSGAPRHACPRWPTIETTAFRTPDQMRLSPPSLFRPPERGPRTVLSPARRNPQRSRRAFTFR